MVAKAEIGIYGPCTDLCSVLSVVTLTATMGLQLSVSVGWQDGFTSTLFTWYPMFSLFVIGTLTFFETSLSWKL